VRNEIIAVILVLLIISIPAYALKHVSEDYMTRQKYMSMLDKLRLWFSRLRFTMVGGKLCSTYPDESGTCHSSPSCKIYCPSSLSGGCAIVKYKPNYEFVAEHHVSPGGYAYVADTYIWENYYCNIDCTCTKYVEQGCGAGPCASNEMYKTRTCEQHCAEEEVCVAGYQECQPQCDFGDIRNARCISETRYSEEWCNQYGEWKYHEGNCASGTCCRIVGGVPRCDSDYCEAPTTTTTTQPSNIDVSITSFNAPSSGTSGQSVPLTYTIKNTGNVRATFLVDAGIISKSTASDWGFTFSFLKELSTFTTFDCCPGQENIEDAWLTLDPGESATKSVYVTAPYPGLVDKCYDNVYYDGVFKDYVAYVSVHNKCYGESGRVTYDWDTDTIYITPETTTTTQPTPPSGEFELKFIGIILGISTLAIIIFMLIPK